MSEGTSLQNSSIMHVCVDNLASDVFLERQSNLISPRRNKGIEKQERRSCGG